MVPPFLLYIEDRLQTLTVRIIMCADDEPRWSSNLELLQSATDNSRRWSEGCRLVINDDKCVSMAAGKNQKGLSVKRIAISAMVDRH